MRRRNFTASHHRTFATGEVRLVELGPNVEREYSQVLNPLLPAEHVHAFAVGEIEVYFDHAAFFVFAGDVGLAEGRKQYTGEVCRQALQINDEFPIHEE